MSDSVQLCMAAHQAPHPWDSPGKNTGVVCHFHLATIYLSNSIIYLQPSMVACGEALPAMQRTWVLSMGREDPLQQEMATHSNVLFFFLLLLCHK